MRFLIASDLHGSSSWCRRLVATFYAQQADRLILLGDILYHGPRNQLPQSYDPSGVCELLNPIADRIIAVRGNCDSEVDQMVLRFPCMADSAVVFDSDAPAWESGLAGRELFLTHGHVFGSGIDGAVDNVPALPVGSAVLYGHTHKKINGMIEGHRGIWFFNPGSLVLPKDGSHSIGIYETGLSLDRAFTHIVFDSAS